MLDVFRENLRALKWVLLLVVASFVVTIFAVWGGGATGGGTGTGNWAAEVDGRTIEFRDVQDQARRLDAAYRQFFGADQYEQQRQSLDLYGLALEHLIEEELLLGEGDRLGLDVTDREVQERLRRDPGLQENGQFIGRDRYLELARSGNFQARRFEEGVRRELMISKVRGLYEDGIQVSRQEVLEEFRRWNERISVDYTIISPADLVGRVEVTAADIESTYRQRGEAYRRPERRSGAWIKLLTEKVGVEVHPTEEQLRQFYDERLLTQYSVEDQRRARHILFRVAADAAAETVTATETRARQVRERIDAGEEFTDLAREFGEDNTAGQGGDLGYFGRQRMVKEFSDPVWQMQVGDVIGPVRTPFGFHLITLLDIQEQRVQSFEEVRDKIRNQVRLQMTFEETRRRLEQVTGAMTGGARFEEAATAAGYEVQRTGLVTADESIEGIDNSFLIVRELFKLEPDQVTDPFGLADGQALLVLFEVVPGEIAPLDEVRDRVEQDTRQHRVGDWIAARVRQASDGDTPESLETVAEQLGQSLQRAADLSRGVSLPERPETASVVERAFDRSEGDWIGPEPLADGSLLVMQVTARQGSPEEFDTQRDTIHRNLILVKRETHYRSILRRMRQQSRIVRNQSLLTETRLN